MVNKAVKQRSAYLHCPLCGKYIVVCGQEVSCINCIVGIGCTSEKACLCGEMDIFKAYESKIDAIRVERNIALREYNRLLRICKRLKHDKYLERLKAGKLLGEILNAKNMG